MPATASTNCSVVRPGRGVLVDLDVGHRPVGVAHRMAETGPIPSRLRRGAGPGAGAGRAGPGSRVRALRVRSSSGGDG